MRRIPDALTKEVEEGRVSRATGRGKSHMRQDAEIASSWRGKECEP